MSIGKLFLAYCLIAVCPTLKAAQWEGPFGLQKGLTVEQLASATKGWKLITPSSPGYYAFDGAPVNYPGVTEYLAVVTPKMGLCKVMATFSLRNVSAYGDEVKSLVSQLTDALTQKYGNPTSKYDYLKAGSIWNKPNDWYMGLYKKERVLSNFWLPESKPNSSPLPNALTSISVKASANGSNRADVDLSYEFNNFSECLESLRRADNAAL